KCRFCKFVVWIILGCFL
uniref:Predicted gene 11116 n=1 Tax=Mus spicilegus TaxID=10103 RepID=A0A8C6GS92_MUSSI